MLSLMLDGVVQAVPEAHASAALAVRPPIFKLNEAQRDVTEELLRWSLKRLKTRDSDLDRIEQELRMIPNLVHYLRIAKTGSSSLLEMFKAAREREPQACSRLATHFHDMLPRKIRHIYQPPVTFAVMREPCERFASTYDYVRRPLAYRKHPDDPVHGLEDGVAGAIEWAKLLLNNKSYRLLWSQHTSEGPTLAEDQTMSHVIGWQQSAYIDNHTKVACLPTMRDDVQAIFDEFLPGCQLPKETIHANEYHAPTPTATNRTLCRKVQLPPSLFSCPAHTCVDFAPRMLRSTWTHPGWLCY